MKNFKDNPLATPVLFLIFRRPEMTQKVFDAIRQARPKELYVCADGPRADKPGEADTCAQTRAIIDKVDWECRVHKRFSEVNLGCRAAVSSGISWFFDHVESGIILEDDCLPSQSFFWFCQDLLDRYRDELRVMQICGSNYLFGKPVTDASYYFSRFNEIWGWATWRRAWKLFNPTMNGFDGFRCAGRIRDYFPDRDIAAWAMAYLEESAMNQQGGIWSAHWMFARCLHDGLTAVPAVPLVANIGFNMSGTNVQKTFLEYPEQRPEEMGKVVHPSSITPNHKADRWRFRIIRRTDPHAGRFYQLKTRLKYNLQKKLDPQTYARLIEICRRLRGQSTPNGSTL